MKSKSHKVLGAIISTFVEVTEEKLAEGGGSFFGGCLGDIFKTLIEKKN